ncbi:Actin-fragmin kinase, partial [Frankliniella fusca]
TNSWRKAGGQKGAAAPRGRRGHSALVYRGSMLVYGGYRDLRGSSNELWAFHFDTESWHIISSGKTVSKSDSIPPARHKHSAVIHDDTMWVYGGMTDLNERQDLWRIDLHRKRWQCVRAGGRRGAGGGGPGPLHSHAACRLPGCMLLFGGERAGQPSADLWRFHFGTETWDRVVVDGPKPSARAEAVALAVSELLLTAAAATTSSTSSSSSCSASASPEVSTTSPSAVGREARSPLQDGLQEVQLRRPRAGGSVDRQAGDRRLALHNRVSPQQQQQAQQHVQQQEKKYVFRASATNYVDGSEQDNNRRNGLHHGQQAGAPQNGSGNLGFLKEISKLSQINLSRLAHHKCNYSVLDADAGESTVDEDGQDQDDGPGVRAGGPRSAPPHGQQQQPTAAKPASKLVKSQSVNLISRRPRPTLSSIPRRKPLPRDNASVPNFTTLASSLPTPVLTPVEAARLVFLDSDEPEEDEELSPRGEYIRPASPGGPVGPGTPVSDENISSTSDYASIETVNRLSSASNYSVSNRPSPVDSGKSSSRPSSGRKTPIKEGPISFCNPNYVGPAEAAARRRQQHQAAVRKSWHAGMASPSPTPTSPSTAARLLNSPPDSLLEDTHGRSSSRCFREDQLRQQQKQAEMVEMQQVGSPPRRAPPPQSLALRNTAHPACNHHHHHHHHHHNNHAAQQVRGASKSRASSASRVERGLARTGGNDLGDGAPARPPQPQPAAVYMFVVGGKEHGQVTVFRRPLSVWKLLLHHYAF